jgi:hypothetical protein
MWNEFNYDRIPVQMVFCAAYITTSGSKTTGNSVNMSGYWLLIKDLVNVRVLDMFNFQSLSTFTFVCINMPQL